VAVAHGRLGPALLQTDVFEKLEANTDPLGELSEGMALIQLPGIIATNWSYVLYLWQCLSDSYWLIRLFNNEEGIKSKI